jgi:protocatechuate 3,4-dioxygenase beta subunit
MPAMPLSRRQLVIASTAALAAPVLAQPGRPLAAMTEGPFYPPRAWREAWPEQDADLTRVTQGGHTAVARGEHLGLEVTVADTRGRVVDGAEVEIWQCDTLQVYRHPREPSQPGRFDAGFQGFGATRSDTAGLARLRTIKPVPYPGRTPHIHVKLRHTSFGELTSQLFIDGDAGNARDFLWRSLAAEDRTALSMQLQPAPEGSGLRWLVRHALIVPV